MGAAVAVLDKYPFWFLVSVWAVAMVFLTVFRGWGDVASLGCLGLATLPFVAAIAGSVFGIGPFTMELTGFKLLNSVSLFALCLVTTSHIGTFTTMCLNRPFVVALTFVLYVALLTARGPIDYYGDVIFQTNHIVSNNVFMTNLIFCGFMGLVLALATNRRLRRATSAGAAAAAKGGAPP